MDDSAKSPEEPIVNGRTVEERLASSEDGYHSNSLECQTVSPKRYKALRAMVKAGLSTDEIIERIKAQYATRQS